MSELPQTRWETGGAGGFRDHFVGLIEQGADIDGEARLADVLVERGARILDAGAGFGRVGAALQQRGHQVVAAEKDPTLVAECRTRYPDLPMVEADILALTPELLGGEGLPTAYDLIVVVGNVMVLLAPDTERRALATLRDLLGPGGRMLVGFHPVRTHGSARDYPVEEFVADAEAAGLALQHRFGTYQLAPPADDYCVAVLTRG